MEHFQSLAASAATLLLAASCSIKEDRIQCHAPVTVSVSALSISQEDIPDTKAVQNVSDYTAVKSITLAFFNSDGSEQYKSTHLRSSATAFGDFSLSLPYGSYKMIVIAHEGDFPITLSSLSEASFGGEKPKDTFLYSQDVVIENSTPVNLSATLSRIITRLIVISTDPKPENVKDVRHST